MSCSPQLLECLLQKSTHSLRLSSFFLATIHDDANNNFHTPHPSHGNYSEHFCELHWPPNISVYIRKHDQINNSCNVRSVASSHFECESTRYCDPKKGPVKSRCNCLHVFSPWVLSVVYFDTLNCHLLPFQCQVYIYAWPPNKTSCQEFHLHAAWMWDMELFEHSPLTFS